METLLQKAQRLGVKPVGQPTASSSESLLQKAERLGIKPQKPVLPVATQRSPSLLDNLKTRYKNATEVIPSRYGKNEQNIGDIALQEAGNAFGVANDVVRKGFEKTGIDKVFGAIAKPVEYVGEKVGTAIGGGIRNLVGGRNIDIAIETIDKNLQENKDLQNFAPKLINDLTAVGETAEFGLNVAGVKQLGGGLKTGFQKITPKVNEFVEARRVANTAKDAKAVDDLAGTITQGKTADVVKAKRALGDIDVSEIKSYEDLQGALNEKIKNLSNKKAEALSTNTGTKKLPDLALESKVGDSTISHNYTQDAITQLKDHYTATNDISALEKIKQLEARANSEGLTIADLDNLAIEHGQAINAFNANGEAAAGLTKQAAENTRTGVKSTARDLFGDPVYGAVDSQISSLIRTRDLVSKMVEKVNELQQKIKTRTWGERAGRVAGQVINLIGMNSPKGLIEYFLGRGTGLKTLNALDLESALSKNLQNLQDALASGASEATIEAKLQQIIDAAQSPQSSLPVKK